MKNLAQVPQEWRPLEIGKGTANLIIKAQSTGNIRTRPENDLKQVLRMAMLMVGLRGANMPTGFKISDVNGWIAWSKFTI